MDEKMKTKLEGLIVKWKERSRKASNMGWNAGTPQSAMVVTYLIVANELSDVLEADIPGEI